MGYVGNQLLILLHFMNNIDICNQLMYKIMIIDKDNTQYVKVCIKAAYSLGVKQIQFHSAVQYFHIESSNAEMCSFAGN